MIGHPYRAANRFLPSRALQKLIIWKPGAIRGQQFRIPVLGALQVEDHHGPETRNFCDDLFLPDETGEAMAARFRTP
jgi:hypothetical protein